METTLQTIKINNHNLSPKEINSQRVVTFKDVDELHERPEGTARRNFNTNKEYFLEGEDFHKISANDIRMQNIMCIDKRQTQDIVFLTEFGYLMLVKSLTDKLAWQVQRQLVNDYFRAKNTPIPIQYPAPLLERKIGNLQTQQQNILDCLSKQAEMLLVHEEQIAELKNPTICKQIELPPTPVETNKKDLIRSIIKPLGQKLCDNSLGYKSTYRKVYKAMDVNWKYRFTRWSKLNGGKKQSSKIDLIINDSKLLDLFRATVIQMMLEN